MDRDDVRFFTGLIKFEKYFDLQDFENAYRIGFRSLYVGLESASEHVLKLMRKNNTQETMKRNLRDSAAAGIWMHCFLFFGFPGERPEDANATIEFMLENANIVGSFGAGTFSLEHNAPIMKNLEKHGLRLKGSQSGDLDVYYDYEPESGLDAAEAVRFMKNMNSRGYQVEKYRVANWIPREHLLIMLSIFSIDELLANCARILSKRDFGLYPHASAEISLTVVDKEKDVIAIINRLNRTVIALRGPSGKLAQMNFSANLASPMMCEHLPWLADGLITVSDVHLSLHESEKVI
jgi:anaerobic magnesium-protoporphyrin IX monomethyl ester cyclase